MNDFSKKRAEFVNSVLKNSSITDKKVLEAFLQTPREEFIPIKYREKAYHDYPLPIGEGQTISQPSLVALMTQLLKLKGGEKVLEIGTGSGFQAAILAKIAREVYSIERIPKLAKKAKGVLAKLGLKNVNIVVGDGTLGLTKLAPFDAIIVTAGAKDIPQTLLEQLRIGGRMVIPASDDTYGQVLKVVKKLQNKIEIKNIEPVAFVPLIGKFGWEK